jgi:hypothetical protein
MDLQVLPTLNMKLNPTMHPSWMPQQLMISNHMRNWIGSIWLYMIATMEQIMGLRITILELSTQDTLINTSISQVGLFVHPTNHIVDAMWQLYWTHKWTQIQTLTLVNPKLVINIFSVLGYNMIDPTWPILTMQSKHVLWFMFVIMNFPVTL